MGLILKPEPGPSPALTFEDLGPKSKFTEWVKIYANFSVVAK